VTADHGIAFRGGAPIRGIRPATVPDIAFTPLIIKAPGPPQGSVDDRPAESVDVLPTIAGHLGVRIPWPVDGRSLLGSPRTTTTFPVFDWSRADRHPPGHDPYFHFDRATEFRALLARRAAPPDDFADQRVFRTGPYDDLLGTIAAPLVDRFGPVHATVALDGPLRYLSVRRRDPRAPYVAVHGWTGLRRAGVPLAIVVNGSVAGLSVSYRAPGSDRVEFWGTLLPRLFHDGRNLVQVFRIEGLPTTPRLRQLTPAGASGATP
jgi:hypothetical protein